MWRHKNTYVTLDAWKFSKKICQLFDLNTISTNVALNSIKLDRLTNFDYKNGLAFLFVGWKWDLLSGDGDEISGIEKNENVRSKTIRKGNRSNRTVRQKRADFFKTHFVNDNDDNDDNDNNNSKLKLNLKRWFVLKQTEHGLWHLHLGEIIASVGR